MLIPKLNILVSYAYYSKSIHQILLANKKNINVYIDSGAYTAYTKGKKVELKTYLEFLDEYASISERYFSLDVIGDEKQSFKNYAKMWEKGESMMDASLWSGDNNIAQRSCTKACVEYAAIVQKHIGSKLFLVCSNTGDVNQVLNSYAKYIKRDQ